MVDEVVEEDEVRAQVCLMLNIQHQHYLCHWIWLDHHSSIPFVLMSLQSFFGYPFIKKLLPFTLSLATSSIEDFVVETLTASFAAGDTVVCVVFTVIDDTLALEGDETFTATLQPPDGIMTDGPLTVTITIIDNIVDDDGMYRVRVCPD